MPPRQWRPIPYAVPLSCLFRTGSNSASIDGGSIDLREQILRREFQRRTRRHLVQHVLHVIVRALIIQDVEPRPGRRLIASPAIPERVPRPSCTIRAIPQGDRVFGVLARAADEREDSEHRPRRRPNSAMDSSPCPDRSQYTPLGPSDIQRGWCPGKDRLIGLHRLSGASGCGKNIGAQFLERECLRVVLNPLVKDLDGQRVWRHSPIQLSHVQRLAP